MILYVPASLPASAPTFMWIHGGSFTSGSASGPGLDGSNLAAATQSVVAVIQYRLGAVSNTTTLNLSYPRIHRAISSDSCSRAANSTLRSRT